LPHKAKQAQHKINVVHHNTLSDRFRIR